MDSVPSLVRNKSQSMCHWAQKVLLTLNYSSFLAWLIILIMSPSKTKEISLRDSGGSSTGDEQSDIDICK